ncbi:MAG: hypothetical protein FWE54_03870 [Methanimicrococcus sp.]|nr:hypothetical protein [Methanimicrococcus sp.]
MEQNTEDAEVTIYRRVYVPTAAWAVGTMLMLIGCWLIFPNVHGSSLHEGIQALIAVLYFSTSAFIIVFVLTKIYFKKGLNFFTHKLFKRERYVILISWLSIIIYALIFGDRSAGISILPALYGMANVIFFISHGYYVYHKFDWMLGFRSRRHEKNRYIYINPTDEEEGVNGP